MLRIRVTSDYSANGGTLLRCIIHDAASISDSSDSSAGERGRSLAS